MINYIDKALLNFFGSIQISWLTPVMVILSQIANHGEVWILTGLVMLIFRKTRKMGLTVLFALAIGFLIGNIILKPVIARTRPFDMYDIELLISKPTDFSFPSGHTLSSFAAATAIVLNNRRFGFPALALASLIAFSRLYLQVHYFSDVLAGMLLGSLCALAAFYTVRFISNKTAKKL